MLGIHVCAEQAHGRLFDIFVVQVVKKSPLRLLRSRHDASSECPPHKFEYIARQCAPAPRRNAVPGMLPETLEHSAAARRNVGFPLICL